MGGGGFACTDLYRGVNFARVEPIRRCLTGLTGQEALERFQNLEEHLWNRQWGSVDNCWQANGFIIGGSLEFGALSFIGGTNAP